jgi:hypothetical protein
VTPLGGCYVHLTWRLDILLSDARMQHGMFSFDFAAEKADGSGTYTTGTLSGRAARADAPRAADGTAGACLDSEDAPHTRTQLPLLSPVWRVPTEADRALYFGRALCLEANGVAGTPPLRLTLKTRAANVPEGGTSIVTSAAAASPVFSLLPRKVPLDLALREVAQHSVLLGWQLPFTTLLGVEMEIDAVTDTGLRLPQRRLLLPRASTAWPPTKSTIALNDTARYLVTGLDAAGRYRVALRPLYPTPQCPSPSVCATTASLVAAGVTSAPGAEAELFFRTREAALDPPVIANITQRAGLPGLLLYVLAPTLDRSNDETVIVSVATWITRNSNNDDIKSATYTEASSNAVLPVANGGYQVTGVLANDEIITPFTAYAIAVQLRLLSGVRTPFSAPITVRSAPDLPSEPDELELYREGVRLLRIAFDVPRPLNGLLEGYRVTVQGQASDSGSRRRSDDAAATQHSIWLPAEVSGTGEVAIRFLGLDEKLVYTVAVQSVNVAGASSSNATASTAISGVFLAQASRPPTETGLLSSGAMAGAIIGAILAALAVWWAGLAYLRRRGYGKRGTLAEMLEEEMDRALSRRFAGMSDDLVVEGAKLSEMAIKRSTLLLRQELHRGAFGALRLATIQGGATVLSGAAGSLARNAGTAGAHGQRVVARIMGDTIDLPHCAAVLLEARVLASLDHPNIATVVGVCIEERPLMIAIEYSEAVGSGLWGREGGGCEDVWRRRPHYAVSAVCIQLSINVVVRLNCLLPSLVSVNSTFRGSCASFLLMRGSLC